MPSPAGRLSERCGSGKLCAVTGVATGSAGPGAGRGAGTVGCSNVSVATAGTLRRRHHSSANTAASSPVAPAIHGQYQPGAAVDSTTAGAVVGDGAAAKSVGSGCAAGRFNAGPAVRLSPPGAGWATGPMTAPCAARGVWTGAGRAAGDTGGRVAAVDGVGAGWLEAGLGAGLGVGVSRGEAVVTIGLSRSTGPCDPGGAGFTVAPGRRQPLSDWAISAAGASVSPSAIALAAAFKLPPDLLILLSITPDKGPLAVLALNRK